MGLGPLLMPDRLHSHPGAPPARAGGEGGAEREPSEHGWLLTVVRYVLPVAIVVGGLVVMSLGGESHIEGGAGIVGAGIAIFFLNWLFRAGARGEGEREAEEAAREYFDRHGRWPD
jgi:hypothetical protein